MRTAVVVLAVAVLVAVALPLLAGRLAGPGRGGVSGARSRARSAHAALGHHVESLPRGDAEADLLVDAARERWTAAGAALHQARTVADHAVAQRAATEGLALVARACAVLDLPPPP